MAVRQRPEMSQGKKIRGGKETKKGITKIHCLLDAFVHGVEKGVDGREPLRIFGRGKQKVELVSLEILSST